MKNALKSILGDQKPDFSDTQMGELSEAVNAMNSKQVEIDDATEVLKSLTQDWRRWNEIVIPELMGNLGFATITLEDGRKVAVKDSLQCSIPAAMKPAAYAWLEANNHGDLIKITVTAKFARGESDTATEAFDALVDIGASPSQAVSVHAGTLKAWARVELEQGHSLPEDCFKVHIVKQTTVK